jgi:type III pantothenate kinase
MLLAIDIGNTNISYALFQKGRLIRKFDIPTKKYTKIKFLNALKKYKPHAAIISSVVPRLLEVLKKDLKTVSANKIYILGKNIKAPIKNKYRYPRQVGQDRLVNAYAASQLYGIPLIVVDYGTAVTFDVISKNREYLGGMILPGLKISLNALAKETALLPQVKLKKPRELIGKDTKNSIISGVVYGFAALTDDLITRIRQKIGKKAKAIGTGGNIKLLAKYCRRINLINPNLTLKGLQLIYKKSGLYTQ